MYVGAEEDNLVSPNVLLQGGNITSDDVFEFFRRVYFSLRFCRSHANVASADKGQKRAEIEACFRRLLASFYGETVDLRTLQGRQNSPWHE
jgi:hypothetical protein